MAESSSENSSGLFSVFNVAVFGCATIGLAGLGYPELIEHAAGALTETVFGALDWFYMAGVSGLLILILWLAFGRYGNMRLGKDDERPEFSTLSWLAMLFSAGMGSGLLFWGVAEPVSHFANPPVGPANTAEAARQAMVITNFHWGLHAWAIYGMAALVVAYFGFRHEMPCLPGAPLRRAFEGRWVRPFAHAADLVAVLAVVFGVAGTLALGTRQIHSGLSLVTGVEAGSSVAAFAILGVVIVAYLTSASTSLDRGIKWLSNINISLATLLMLFLLFAGPTAFLLRTFVTGIGDYVSGLGAISLGLYPYQNVGPWLRSWTLTYFIWWIAWAPFVGVFIARISRGRTLRQFVLGVLLAPTAFTMLWFAVFGGTAFHQQTHQGGLARLVREDLTRALFSVFEQMPMGTAMIGLTIVLIFVFVVTSVDSATYVLSMMTTNGEIDAPTRRKITWGVLLGVMGGLLVTGSVDTVRAVTVTGAIPFTFILLTQVGALLRQLKADTRDARDKL